MTMTELDAWTTFTTSNPGAWRVDPVHNGSHDRLLAYAPAVADPTSGSYVDIDGARWEIGTYQGAVPHVGEALFRPNASGTCRDHLTARLFAADIVGPAVLGVLPSDN
jgi:hypothetical protein